MTPACRVRSLSFAKMKCGLTMPNKAMQATRETRARLMAGVRLHCTLVMQRRLYFELEDIAVNRRVEQTLLSSDRGHEQAEVLFSDSEGCRSLLSTRPGGQEKASSGPVPDFSRLPSAIVGCTHALAP